MAADSRHGSFVTTRWTLVLAAVGSPTTPKAGTSGSEPIADPTRALTELCRTYWPPLYTHARRHPLSPPDAEDAVQGFFARLLRLESLTDVDRERGRFRAFLLGSFNHYLADLRDYAKAEKRGKHLLPPLDPQSTEAAFVRTPSTDLTPDRAFDHAWALALLKAVTIRLRDEHVAAGRVATFDVLGPSLAGRRSDTPHSSLAEQLGMSEPAIRVTLHRLRQRYRQLLHEEIGKTVARAEDTDDELRLLLAALSQS